jgi:hypothetical protein
VKLFQITGCISVSERAAAILLCLRTAEDTAMDAAQGADEFPQTATLSSQA